VFTTAERDEVRERLLEHARADERVVAAALTGSRAAGAEDAWSDVDVGLGIADGVELAEVVASWTELLETEFGVIHHWDLQFRATTFRVFLLASGLEVDLAFTPHAEFASYGPGFQTVFGTHVEREPPEPATNDHVGMGWHHALHARTSIERGKPWQAEYWIAATRNHAIELACIRLDLPAVYARSTDSLPDALKTSLEPALARSLDEDELRRALRAATEVLLAEIRQLDPPLADRLARLFEERASL
jgi:predicted nucleotidyltransferase